MRGGVSKPISLATWGATLRDPPPSERTLRRWRERGNILPQPKKIGRGYFVMPTARYIDPSDPNYLEEVARALSESSPQ